MILSLVNDAATICIMNYELSAIVSVSEIVIMGVWQTNLSHLAKGCTQKAGHGL